MQLWGFENRKISIENVHLLQVSGDVRVRIYNNDQSREELATELAHERTEAGRNNAIERHTHVQSFTYEGFDSTRGLSGREIDGVLRQANINPYNENARNSVQGIWYNAGNDSQYLSGDQVRDLRQNSASSAEAATPPRATVTGGGDQTNSTRRPSTAESIMGGLGGLVGTAGSVAGGIAGLCAVVAAGNARATAQMNMMAQQCFSAVAASTISGLNNAAAMTAVASSNAQRAGSQAHAEAMMAMSTTHLTRSPSTLLAGMNAEVTGATISPRRGSVSV